jgi:hypothetical protein
MQAGVPCSWLGACASLLLLTPLLLCPLWLAQVSGVRGGGVAAPAQQDSRINGHSDEPGGDPPIRGSWARDWQCKGALQEGRKAMPATGRTQWPF